MIQLSSELTFGNVWYFAIASWGAGSPFANGGGVPAQVVPSGAGFFDTILCEKPERRVETCFLCECASLFDFSALYCSALADATFFSAT